MGITLRKKDLELTLERGMRQAESPGSVSDLWTERTVHIGDCPNQTYVAALGVALLAKATDIRVDALTVKASVSPTAYSMRGPAKVIAARARDYDYHLGVTGPEPLNNQPWFHGERIDRMTRIDGAAQPFHNAFVRYMRELNTYDSGGAFEALAAFLRERHRYAKKNAAIALTQGVRPDSFSVLCGALEGFIREDTEGGRRGQALVAAVMEAAFGSVTTGGINHPRANDVQVHGAKKRITAALEAKQKPVDDGWSLAIAEGAAKAGVDSAVMVALAVDQKPLDRSFLRSEADRLYGVTLTIVESVEELLAVAITWSQKPRLEVIGDIPACFRRRLKELEASASGVSHWSDIEAGLNLKR